MVTNQRLKAQIDLDGFAIKENVRSGKIVESLVRALELAGSWPACEGKERLTRL